MVDAYRWSDQHFWATDSVQQLGQLRKVHGFAGIQQYATGLQVFDRQRQFGGRQRPVKHLHRTIGAADQPRAQPQMRFQWQVGVIDQQQRGAM
ncbi:hypothetical protein D3C78_1439910 [compost metagenome]